VAAVRRAAAEWTTSVVRLGRSAAAARPALRDAARGCAALAVALV
jgi:hypothetical protein